MRLRLGLLRDVSSIDRQAAKETAAEAHVKKIKPDGQAAEAGSAFKDDVLAEKAKAAPKLRIRPLSESKAIDSGANFISEAFLFAVAGSLIVFESLRARRKESNRREDVAERLAMLEESEQNARRALAVLEKELIAIETGDKHVVGKKRSRILPKEVWQDQEDEMETEAPQRSGGLWSWLQGFISRGQGSGDNSPSETAAREVLPSASSSVSPASPKDSPISPSSTSPSSPNSSSPRR